MIKFNQLISNQFVLDETSEEVGNQWNFSVIQNTVIECFATNLWILGLQEPFAFPMTFIN